MAKVLTICSNKGGCGKTTTAANLGAALFRKGFDVLLIDADGQCNLTAALRIGEAGGTTYDGLTKRNGTYIKPAIIAENSGCRLCAIPGSPDLSALDVDLAEKSDRLTRFKTFADCYRPLFDAVIIDTPPANGLLTISAIYATDNVIIPVTPEYFAVQGLLQTSGTIERIAESRGVKIHTRAVITNYDGRKSLHKMTAEQLSATGKDFFNTRIRTNVALAEAQTIGGDIFGYSPKSYGAQDYMAIAGECVDWLRLKHMKHGALK